MRFASTSSSTAAAGAGPAVVGMVCAAAKDSQHKSPAAAVQIRRIIAVSSLDGPSLLALIAHLWAARACEPQDIMRSGEHILDGGTAWYGAEPHRTDKTKERTHAD